MREVRLPNLNNAPEGGAWVAVPVKVDWPEVQLTEQQQWENSVARAAGKYPQHDDHSFFTVLVPRGTRI